MSKFTITKGKDEQYYFNLKAGNGEIILTGEGYTQKPSCLNGISSVQKNSQDADRFEKKESANGQFFFVLKASNGQVIGKSQMYKTAQGRDNGIEAVQRAAADAQTEDLS